MSSGKLYNSFRFPLFAKRPVERITTLAEHRAVTTKNSIVGLQVRLPVLARAEPLFSFVEFQHLIRPEKRVRSVRWT